MTLHAIARSLPALLFALIGSALCRAAAGVSLGLFFGGFAFATLVMPPLTAGEASIAKRILVPTFVTAGTALIWLTALGDLLTISQWVACSAAFFAYAFALGGVCSLLLTLRFQPSIAAGAVTLLGLLWLTWPVWLSVFLLRLSGDALVAWLVPAHPLFAINGVLAHFDTWDRYPLAYSRLTVLNQDVFYELPRSVACTVVVHGMLGAIALISSRWMRPRESASTPCPAATAAS